MVGAINKQSCHNCKNAYPNYLEYDQGPCKVFELYFGEEEWETLDFNVGCKNWESKIRQ